MFANIVFFLRDLRIGFRSLAREKGLTAAVIVTLALGIGANAVMFSLVRGVLLRPLANRDEDHLIYIRQTSGGRNAAFSMPEIADLRSRVKTLNAWGDFSALGFSMVGLGAPREVTAGVVGGSYFKVMGLRPVLGRLLDERDDGPKAAGAMVLTYRFWSTTLKGDPTVIGKQVRLDSFIDSRVATVVGVLEPCVPYPQDTEVIANVVMSAHHLSAEMVTNRIHRMTELFARLAPGANLEMARTELRTVYGAMKQAYPKDYPPKDDFRISAVKFRDELTSGARTILLVLMAASILVFVIACSNVANLILARTIRREGELGIRAALGASRGALRRTLLSESLLLCTAGAALGVFIAGPMLSIFARYMSQYSVRALDLTIDSSMLWVGAGLAIIAAVLLAYIPRLPSSGSAQGLGLASGSARVTSTAANRKLKAFAIVQIAASFVLVASAGATVKTLLSLEAAQTGFDTSNVLSVEVPVMHLGKTPAQIVNFYREAARQIRELPGVQSVAIDNNYPWRGDGDFGLQFAVDGRAPTGEESPRARIRIISPAFFATLGLPILEGRDFTEADRNGGEQVAVVSQSLAQRLFPHGGALGHHLTWNDPLLQVIPPGFINTQPMRIVGVVPDVDDDNIVPRPTNTVYRPFDQERAMGGGVFFVHVGGNPYALVTPITRLLRNMASDQPVEHAATLDDVRAKVLSPDRLNAIVFGSFAAVALLIAVIGVAGVLAFSVSGRTREFGIRLAFGSEPRRLLLRVIAEGGAIAVAGLVAGMGLGYLLARVAGNYLAGMQTPGVLPVASSAIVLLIAAVTASWIPAARAARVDVIQALRTE